MGVRLSNAARTDMITALVDLVVWDDATPATAELWSGDKPGALGGSPAGDLVATFELPEPFYTGVSNGVATVDHAGIDPEEAENTVDIGQDGGFIVIRDGEGTAIWDNDSVGGTGSGAEIQLSAVVIGEGTTVTITSWTVTQPAEAPA